MMFLFSYVIFRLHVDFPGCKCDLYAYVDFPGKVYILGPVRAVNGFQGGPQPSWVPREWFDLGPAWLASGKSRFMTAK